MAATAGLKFNIGTYGENVSKYFFSETTWTIETKLPKNDHWMVLYKISVFRSSRIFNMAARANNMLWLAEISKIFFSETNELTEPKL